MYTQEVVQAMVDDRRREAVEIERQARAMRALRRGRTFHGAPSREREQDRSLISSVLRFVRAATAAL